MSATDYRCGTIAIVGRPNVGKSTLLNYLIGKKISITSRKAQTTRHRITGILSSADTQYVFVDTPGFQTKNTSVLNRLMNRSITQALQDVDLILTVIEAGRISREDRQVFDLLPPGRPAVLALNKIDRLADKKLLLPLLAQLQAERSFSDIVPLCAKSGEQTQQLLKALRVHLPQQPAIYSAGEVTDRSERFLAAELVREKLFRQLGDELPYGASTCIEKFETEGKLRRIHVAIIVDKASHKAMVIGKGGEKLKLIGTDARRDMEKLFGGKVFLQIWVKVKHGWADDERTLKNLGFEP
ncbi:MAG: GTPase Era [Betaproteobacteria bacterium]|nr:MAG: GTPase Era [Betaproteobacteria bacterium]